MPLRLPEPGTFEHLLRPATVAVSSLVRLSRFPSTEPYWSKAARYRFDDALPGQSSQFGVCYGATTLETAFAESVLRENALFEGGRFMVADADLRGRWEVRFAHPKKKRLRVVDLTGLALKLMGLNNDISAGDDYTVSQRWARAIHDADPTWDGIRYVARQSNKGFAYALFERTGLTRAAQIKLEGVELDALCQRFGMAALK